MRLRKGRRGGGGEGGWWDGLLIARGNATYYNNISAKKNRCHKSRFSNGFIDNSINVSTNKPETHFFHTNSSRRIFWCVCQPLGRGRIKVEMDEFDKAARVYMLASPTSS